jgi:AcrR family transcriptional regulator
MPEQNASQEILDAAERVFALCGFEGASMRQIATEAGVAQALLHYHFGTKEKLFHAMFARRSEAINTERAARLENLFGSGGQGHPSLADLIEALFRPTVEFGHKGQSGNMFSRILAATANADDERSRALVGTHYDAIAQRFIQSFRRVIPDLKPADAVWSYMFAIGIGMTMMASTGRAERLSGGICDDRDVDAIMARMVPFISGGIKALAADEINSESRASAPSRRAGTRGR